MKLKLTPGILKLAYKFIDVESLGESSVLDGRTIEYGFAISKLARLPVGRLLDVGCVARVNPVVSTMCELGWKVDGIDIRDYKYSHPNFTFIKGDITENPPLDSSYYDTVTAISTFEHIGVRGRYGIRSNDGLGIFKAVAQIRKILNTNGVLIATLPIGSVFKDSQLGKEYTPSMVEQIFTRWENWTVRDLVHLNGLVLLCLVKK